MSSTWPTVLDASGPGESVAFTFRALEHRAGGLS
jgi:hypothetical protein